MTNTELLNELLTYCNEDSNYLYNRIAELVDAKGEGDADAIADAAAEDTTYLTNRLEELVALRKDQLLATIANWTT